MRKEYVNNEKKCGRCHEVKPTNEFAVHGPRYLRSYCIPCHSEARAENKRRQMYGLTPELYMSMLAVQGGYCAICDNIMDPPQVDHDHACCSGRNKATCGNCVRSLLCGSCNSILGYAKDDVQILKNAIAYLERN